MDKEKDGTKQLHAPLDRLTAITIKIQDFLKKEVKASLTKFKDKFNEEVRCKWSGFKEETIRKVAQNVE